MQYKGNSLLQPNKHYEIMCAMAEFWLPIHTLPHQVSRYSITNALELVLSCQYFITTKFHYVVGTF
jgi:hypothetical protein